MVYANVYVQVHSYSPPLSGESTIPTAGLLSIRSLLLSLSESSLRQRTAAAFSPHACI